MVELMVAPFATTRIGTTLRQETTPTAPHHSSCHPGAVPAEPTEADFLAAVLQNPNVVEVRAAGPGPGHTRRTAI